MTLPLSESDYQAAVKSAEDFIALAEKNYKLYAVPVELWYATTQAQIAKALIQAHSERRTPGTRELCAKHDAFDRTKGSLCTNVAMAGYECRIPECPVRVTAEELRDKPLVCPLHRGNAP